jgi:hypothetical protein
LPLAHVDRCQQVGLLTNDGLNPGQSSLLVGTLTRRNEHKGDAMAKPRKRVEQPQGDPARDRAEAALSMEALGEQLLRQAREGQAKFDAGWLEFMEQLAIEGQPIAARELRAMLLREAINPASNEFSRGIIAMREE